MLTDLDRYCFLDEIFYSSSITHYSVPHLQRSHPSHVIEGPLVDLSDVVVTEVDGLQGVEAAEAVSGQVPDEVVAHVEIPETTTEFIL